MFKVSLERMCAEHTMMRIIVDPHPKKLDEDNKRWCAGYAYPDGGTTYFPSPGNGLPPQHGLTPEQLKLCQELTERILNDPEKLAKAQQWAGDEEARQAREELRNNDEERTPDGGGPEETLSRSEATEG